jgi:hypothetical protein
MKEHIAKLKIWWNKPLEFKPKVKEGFHCPDCISTIPHEYPHSKKRLPDSVLKILNDPKTTQRIAKAMTEGERARLEHERFKRFFDELKNDIRSKR